MRRSSTSQGLLILTLHFHTAIAQFLQCAVSAYSISECHSQLALLPPLLHLLLPIQPAVIHAQGTFILKPELTVMLTESSAPVPSCSLAKPHSQNQRHSLSHHQRQSQSTLLACRAQLAFSRGCTVPPQWGWSSAASQSGWLTRPSERLRDSLTFS